MIRHSFEVLPLSHRNKQFVPFLIEVPALTTSDEDHARAARRAYFSVMSLMAKDGFDIEDFVVREYDVLNRKSGRVVTTGGFDDTDSNHE